MKLPATMALLWLALTSIAQAQNVSGTVLNGTLRHPAVGDEVLLLRYGQGLQQVARTTTDANGRYSFNNKLSGPYVVRVIHNGQVYDREPHPGARYVDLEVFDTASMVKQVSTAMVVVGLQAHTNNLQAVELHVLENTSNPPRALDGSIGFEASLPRGAELEWVRGKASGERPVNIFPVQIGNNSYRVHFPLRPGETRLQIAYRIKYSGSTTVSLRFPEAARRVDIIVPEGLHFTPLNGLHIQRVKEQGAELEMLAGVAPGQTITFHVAGVALAENPPQDNFKSQPARAPAPTASETPPVGHPNEGHAPPIRESNALHSVYILTAALILISIATVGLRVVLPRLKLAARS